MPVVTHVNEQPFIQGLESYVSRSNRVTLTRDELFELDRNARAYGWEIGHGQPLGKQINASDDNPFMSPNWRDPIKEEHDG